jgi:plasmid stabilization system protein ParE
MRRRTKLSWSRKAERKLRELRERIANAIAPRAAKSYIRRLRKHVDQLRDFPELGALVEAFGLLMVREIGFQQYRILYDYDGVLVLILTIEPAAAT